MLKLLQSVWYFQQKLHFFLFKYFIDLFGVFSCILKNVTIFKSFYLMGLIETQRLSSKSISNITYEETFTIENI